MSGNTDQSNVNSKRHVSDDITVIAADDVGFVPERFFPMIGDTLQVATATSLLSEFATCPECDHDIKPDATDGVKSDRDVVWTDQRSPEQASRSPIDRANAHTCENCGETLRLFVEEKARPSQWSEIPDEHWASAHLWIEMENGDYFVTNPAHVTATVEQ